MVQAGDYAVAWALPARSVRGQAVRRAGDARSRSGWPGLGSRSVFANNVSAALHYSTPTGVRGNRAKTVKHRPFGLIHRLSTVSFSGARQALTVNQARRSPGNARKRTKARKECPDASRYRGVLIEINGRECLALSAVTRIRSSRPWEQLILGSLKRGHVSISDQPFDS
jgi:hypothetical protein